MSFLDIQLVAGERHAILKEESPLNLQAAPCFRKALASMMQHHALHVELYPAVVMDILLLLCN
jgi:hypothetical protein